MTITINVKQEHIDKGIINNCEQCPIALAVMDRFPSLKYVNIRKESLFFSNADFGGFDDGDDVKFFYGEMPMEARVFIHKFDNKLETTPFSFKSKLIIQH